MQPFTKKTGYGTMPATDSLIGGYLNPSPYKEKCMELAAALELLKATQEKSNMKKWDRRFLDLAKFISAWSKDPSTKVGAVISNSDNQIISLGYNGLSRHVIDSEERLLDRRQKYEMIVHAEINAILFAKQSLYGCTLYTYPFQPCSRCAALIIQTGIKRVVTIENTDERWEQNFTLANTLFKEGNIQLVTYPYDDNCLGW